MAYEEELKRRIEDVIKYTIAKRQEYEEIQAFIIECKNMNLSVDEGINRFKSLLAYKKLQPQELENITEFEKNKRRLQIRMPQIPAHITESWLHENLKHNLFYIHGFSYADLSNCTFENISEKTLRRISVSTYTELPEKHPFNLDLNTYIDRDIQELHNQGINGSGVNIAVIDLGFLTIHDEIKDILIDYKSYNDVVYSFHGLVVSSNLAGKNTGVAPNANIHFYGISQTIDAGGPKDSIEALKDIYHKNLNGANIKIVSISGFMHTLDSEFVIIKEKLREQECYIIDSPTFGKYLTCINQRNKKGIPNYYYSAWQQEEGIEKSNSLIAVPFTSLMPLAETTSSYKIGGDTSYSWAIPRLSGIYALCLQLKPDMTLDELLELIIETKKITEDGIQIINPQGMIEKLKQDLSTNKTL